MVAAVAMTGHVASAIRKQREVDAGAHASSFSPRTSAHGMVLPLSRVGLPSAVNLSVNTPQRHTQRCGSSQRRPHPEVVPAPSS